MAKKLHFESLANFNKGQSSKLFKFVFKTKEPMVVTSHGKAMAVILSADEFERITKRKLQVSIYTEQEKETM